MEALGSGVDLSEVVLVATQHHRYTHTFSPFEHYLDYEGRFVPLQSAPVLALVDGIAEAVGWRMLLHTGEERIGAAEDGIWARGEQRLIPEWIAEELARSGAIYAQETLLSRSFAESDSTLYHLDCDLISHVFLHVGYRLDLDFREVNSPLHTYLSYHGAGGDLTIEPTAFRQTTIRDGLIEVGRIGVAPGFFIRQDYHRESGQLRASAELIAAAGFYELSTERDIRDGIVSEVMAGLSGLARRDGDRERLAVVGEELEAHLEGTRDPNLVSNLFLHYLQQGEDDLETGDVARAVEAVARAVQIRQSHDALLLHSEPMESVLEAKVLIAQGKRRTAAALLERICARYSTGDTAFPEARGSTHADALLTLASVYPPGMKTYNRTILPVLNFERRVFPRGNTQRRQRAWELCAEMLASSDPARASACQEQAAEQ